MKLNENVLDPIQDELNPLLWSTDKKVKPEIKNAILKLIYEHIEKNKITGIYFVGSSTGYQYTDKSDIDIHIFINGITEEESETYFDLLPKNIFYKTHPIQFHVEESEIFSEEKGSVYNILKDIWVIEPTKEFIQIPFEYILEISRGFMSYIDNQIQSYLTKTEEYSNMIAKNEDTAVIDLKVTEIKASLDSLYLLKDMMYKLRSGGYEGDTLNLFIPFSKGNYSIQNMIYKMLERTGYIDKLKMYAKIRKEK